MRKQSPIKKLDLVLNAVLKRLTEFELQTHDQEFFLLLEDFRDEIIEGYERVKGKSK